MARNLLVGKKTFNGVSKLSVRDADGITRHIYQESGTPAEISTAKEMAAVIAVENAGKIYKYVGESTEEYTKGQLYSVTLVATGENVVKLTASDVVMMDGAAPFAVALDFPFEHNFTDGQAIDIVYRMDGVENTKTVYYRAIDAGDDKHIMQTWADEQTGNIGDGIDLEEGTKSIIYVMSYFNYVFDPTAEDGIASGQMWLVEGMEENSYDSLEIVSIGGLKNPATAKLTKFVDAGDITNPTFVSTAEEMDALETSANSERCFRYVGGDAKRYENDAVYTVNVKNGIPIIERVLTFSDLAMGHNSLDEEYIKLCYLGSVNPSNLFGAFSFGTVNLALDMTDTNSTSYTIGSFGYMPELKRLVLRQKEATNVPTLTADAFAKTGITVTTGAIYVEDPLVESYKAAEGWSEYANVIRPLSEFDVDGHNYLDGDVQITSRVAGGQEVNAYEVINKKLPLVEGLTYRVYLNIDGTEYAKEVKCVNGDVSNNIGVSEASTLGDFGENACTIIVDAENDKGYIFMFMNGATLSTADGTEESMEISASDGSSVISIGVMGLDDISKATLHAITLASDPTLSF